MDEQKTDSNTTNLRKTAKSGLGAAVTTAHAALCPVHGVIPGVAKAVGTTAALTEYEALKPFAYIHEKQVDYTSAALHAAHLPGSSIDHIHETQTHTEHVHQDVHPYTDTVVSGTNLVMASIATAYFIHTLYKTIKGKQK